MIDRLSTGVRYQFKVTVNAMTFDGTVLEGERSEVNEDSIVITGGMCVNAA